MTAASAFRNVFPDNSQFVIFVAYMALFINLGLMIKGSQTSSGSYDYNPVMAVFMTELCKLAVAIFIYLREGHSVTQFKSAITENFDVAARYFIPAGLYALYNVLTYYNLLEFDPTTYFLLLQFRVVVTGVIFQLLFQQRLTRTQWLSLFVLTLGCVIKEYKPDPDGAPFTFSRGLVLILFQVFCSCFAGVYNEYLLKGHTGDVHVMIQNVFMYTDSLIVYFLKALVERDFSMFTTASLESVLNVRVLLLILNNAALGIIVSLFLKRLNSILKTFASALELVFTAVLSWFFFGIPVDSKTWLAIVLVSVSLYIYSFKPVDTTKEKAQQLPTSSKPAT